MQLKRQRLRELGSGARDRRPGKRGPLSGNLKFFGVIYALNSLRSSTFGVVQLRGNVQVQGRIFVDGLLGGVDPGSSKVNVVYDDFKDALAPFTTYGTAGIVQNSWRELNVGQ